jgi:hypothetical protein
VLAAPGDAAGAERCARELAGGRTLVLRGLGHRSPAVAALQAEVCTLLGVSAGANLYCTPAGALGLCHGVYVVRPL